MTQTARHFIAPQATLGQLAPVPPPQTLQTSSGTVLTVGAGMEFATLNDALRASVDGDTIAVESGTYTNDFCTINTSVHIVAVGGVVNEVATVPPPNDKGILLVNDDVTIQGFTFTGGSDGSPDGNVAGIRYQAGNMTVSYCYFHDMQEGLLAAPPTQGQGSITIDHSEFANCGTGDGYTHDIYVGDVGSFTLTNSYIHGAVVGHEVKSRAAITTIRDNVIVDGPTGTGSYDIDVPNAGVATIEDNIIEKGPHASNWPAIHYGGETQIAWANNSLAITGNTILNDLGPNGLAVLNQSAANGLNVAAQIDGDSFYGFAQNRLLSGAGAVTNASYLTSEPAYSTTSPWTSPPAIALTSGPELLNLINGGHTVTGGVALLQVNDSAGNNTISGGAGGLHAAIATSWDSVSTLAHTANTLSFGGRNDVVHSAGADSIAFNSLYGEVDATGAATIGGASFSTYNLAGAETITVGGGGYLNVASTGSVSATLTAGINIAKAAGGVIRLAGQATSSGATATIAGGAASFWDAGGTNLAVTFGDGGGAATLGGGAFTITGGAGNDSIAAGSGTAHLALGAGTDVVRFSTGSATVQGGSGTDSYVFNAASAGAATIAGFKPGTDKLVFTGFTKTPIASGTIAGGNTMLILSDGATIELVGVVLPGYSAGLGAGDGPGGGPGGGTGGVTGGGIGDGGPPQSGTLTTHGNSITGGAGLLTISDIAGGNTITGGAGGILAALLTGDVIGTAAGSTNHLTLAGHDTLTGAGQDAVAITSTYNTDREQGPASVSIAVWGNIVQGGTGLLAVQDYFGGNTLTGGAGGLAATVTGTSEQIVTQAGASDTVSTGGYSTLTLAGNDTATLTGNYSVVHALGTDVIDANGGWSTFDLQGQDTVQGVGAGIFTIGAQAVATLISTGAGGSAITKQQGGSVSLQQTMPDGSTASVTVAGGQATLGSSGGRYPGITVSTLATMSGGAGVSVAAGTGPATIASNGADTVWAGAGPLVVHATGALTLQGGNGPVTVTGGVTGMDVTGGSGNITLQGGTGNDSFSGGTGSAVLMLGSGQDSITLGSGISLVHAGASDMFDIVASIGSTGGMDTITGWSGTDSLSFTGFTGNPVVSDTVSLGSTFLVLSDGTHIELANFAHFT